MPLEKTIYVSVSCDGDDCVYEREEDFIFELTASDTDLSTFSTSGVHERFESSGWEWTEDGNWFCPGCVRDGVAHLPTGASDGGQY